MKRSGYKKLPVYRGRVDEIVGYVDMFDLAEWYGRNLSIKDFIRPVAVFPEFTSLQEALETFKSTKEGMGIVVDELEWFWALLLLMTYLPSLWEAWVGRSWKRIGL